MKELILVFEVKDSVMKQRLRQALMPLKMRVKYISPSDYGKTVGQLAGLPKPAALDGAVNQADTTSASGAAHPTTTSSVSGAAHLTTTSSASGAADTSDTEKKIPENKTDEKTIPQITAPMLVFVGLTDARLDAVLMNMRKRNVRIPYKAILTPHNQAWLPGNLFRELCKEHEIMSKQS